MTGAGFSSLVLYTPLGGGGCIFADNFLIEEGRRFL